MSADPTILRYVRQREHEMEVGKLLGRLTEECWSHCVSSIDNGQLKRRENKCMRNCTSRYMEASVLLLDLYNAKSSTK